MTGASLAISMAIAGEDLMTIVVGEKINVRRPGK
jgi:hypothetical protein